VKAEDLRKKAVIEATNLISALDECSLEDKQNLCYIAGTCHGDAAGKRLRGLEQ
jgi:hypothetical protein